MFIEICLAIFTVTMIALVLVLLRISSQAQKSIHLLQTDIQALSKEAISLLNSFNEFVRADLHAVSEETHQLISQLKDLSSDINNKSHSLNFLFRPLNFLSSKLGRNLPAGNSTPENCETIPQTLKWIASSALLFKTIREVIKAYEKRK